MAVVCALRTSGLYLLLFLTIYTCAESPPWILNVKLNNYTCNGNKCVYNLDVKGLNEWSLTYEAVPRGGPCAPEFEVVSSSNVHIQVPNTEKKLYFCVKSHEGVWLSQGEQLYLDGSDVIGRTYSDRSDINDHLYEEIESLEAHNSIENEIEIRGYHNDVAVNNDGEEIADTIIETFSYPPRKMEKYQSQQKNSGVDELEYLLTIKDHGQKMNELVRHLAEQIPDSILKDSSKQIERTKYQSNSPDLAETVAKLDGTIKILSDLQKRIDKDIADISLDYNSIDDSTEKNERTKRQAPSEPTNATDVAADATDSLNATKDVVDAATSASNDTSLGPKVDKPVYLGPIKVMGLRIEESDKEPKIVDEMIPSVLRETNFMLRIFGEGLTNETIIAFTHTPDAAGNTCDHLLTGEYKVDIAVEDSALLTMVAPPPLDDYKFYICAKNGPGGHFIHQGPEKWKILATHNKLLPLWASLILIVILLMLASLFSGLNLGLMALDRTELKIIANTGTEKERKYARAIMPVRAHGNYLLCTILLSNVAVNSTFTVILDDLTSGLVAVIGSTLAIVFIAEITPQAICARHGLFIGAKSIWIMKIVMGICAPLAWPTSKLLDYFLGEEIGTHYNRERLKELVRVTNHVNDLDKEEVNIISGALDLRKKTVRDVMTKLKDCFMLPINSVLDFETMSEIVKSGYSRIPVYEGSRGNIVTVLFIKDLAFVDPDDNTPLRTLCQYYQNPCNFVFEDVTLDVMLKHFKEGHKGHMAFVQRIEEGDGDPVYETVGLVTLEDVIEEMIQAEIVDETDVISDNRTKKRVSRPLNKFQDMAAFVGHHEHQRVHVSPQLVLATFQFLSTSVDPFRPEMISETVLRRLLKQDVIQHIKLRGDEDKNDLKRYVYQEGKPVDYFVLILEGRVEVTVGRENLVFEAGPFTYFGVQALTQNVGLAETPAPSSLGSLQNLNMDSMLRHTFVPDYSVRAIAELYYLTIKRSIYLAAKRATLMEKGVLNKGGTNEQIEPEVDKLLREGDRIEEVRESDDLSNKHVPTSASPHTNSTFKSLLDKDELNNPEEERLLKK